MTRDLYSTEMVVTGNIYYKIGGWNTAITKKIKYLKTYMTNKLNRRVTVKEIEWRELYYNL